jgi:hypothetical protein
MLFFALSMERASSKAASSGHGLFIGLRTNSFQVRQDKSVPYISQSATHYLQI